MTRDSVGARDALGGGPAGTSTKPSIAAITAPLEQRDYHRQQFAAYLRLGELRRAFLAAQASFKSTFEWHGHADNFDAVPDHLLLVTVCAATGFPQEAKRNLR